MTVASECTIATTPLAFGIVGIITTAVDATATITVQCTEGSAYAVSLGAGAAVGATTDTRQLTDTVTPANVADYQLFQDGDYTTPWGNVVGTDTLDAATSTGADEILTVHGRVAADQNLPAGTYEDTVLATITYGTSL